MAQIWFIAVLLSIAAWLTHIIHCLITAKYLLLIAGALVAPVGVIHGIGIWFGASW
jgi:hypothetical protein